MKNLFLSFLCFSLMVFSCSNDDNRPQTEAPKCDEPINITVSNITNSSATISWDLSENQIDTSLEYGESDFVIGQGNLVQAGALTEFNITSLIPNTTYEVYIKAICSNNLESDYSAVVSFTTSCFGGAVSGDITLFSQQEVNDFGLECYTTVDGTLFIGGPNSDINSLEPLSSLVVITDWLFIEDNAQLTSLSGLNNIESIGLVGTLGGIHLENNDGLINLNGLEGLNYVETGLTVIGNDNLISLQGVEPLLQAQTPFYEVYLANNNSLTTLNLEGLTDCVGVYIYNNNMLTTLNSFDNLAAVQDMYIEGNANLSDFCALQNLFTNGFYDVVNIDTNLYNPTVQDIIDGNCSQ